jgi:flagellar motor switch protein FliG
VAADLLSVSDRQTQDCVIAWLSDRDRELGRELKRRVMTMKDIVDFSDEELGKLLKRVDTSAWAGALRSTIPSVAKRVLGCMAPRASHIVTSEMAAFDPLDEKALQWAVEKVMSEAVKLRNEIPGADKPAWR